MYIVKSGGQTESFDAAKLRSGLRRAGVPDPLLDRVTNAVSERVRNGTTTARIRELVRDQLKRESRAHLYRYTLREALLKLGPAGFKFEKYVGSILESYGYRVEYPDELHGACVDHEVDIVARKDGRTIMIEAKFRNDFQYFVRLKDTLATWARYEDLRDGAKAKRCPKFDEVWIVTNGRISSRSQRFGECRGIRMLGWRYPDDRPLAAYVDHVALYPVTVLHELKPRELERLSDRGLMLCRQVADLKPKHLAKSIGVSSSRAGTIIETCRMVVTHEGSDHPPHQDIFASARKRG